MVSGRCSQGQVAGPRRHNRSKGRVLREPSLLPLLPCLAAPSIQASGPARQHGINPGEIVGDTCVIPIVLLALRPPAGDADNDMAAAPGLLHQRAAAVALRSRWQALKQRRLD